MSRPLEPRYAVPRRINLTGRKFGWQFPGVSQRRKPLSFYPLAWLLFLFCWLVFEILRIWILTGGFLDSSTRGLDLALPDFTVTVADLVRLEAGIPLEKPDVNPSRDRYVVLEINPTGRVSLKGRYIDLDEAIPWAMNNREAQETLVFLRPLPGVTYGSVVTVLDQLRSQSYFWDLEVYRIILVRCELDPTPYTSFQRTQTRAFRGLGPLNSDR